MALTASAHSIQTQTSCYANTAQLTLPSNKDPPKTFHFNATRADTSHAQLRADWVSSSRTGTSLDGQVSPANQLPLAYRHRTSLQSATVATPPSVSLDSQLRDSSIAYVNVGGGGGSASRLQQQHQQFAGDNSPQVLLARTKQRALVKLICDIDLIFPVPEVNIYKLTELGRVKLAKSDTKVEQRLFDDNSRQLQANKSALLYHLQVVSFVDEAELQSEPNSDKPTYFECAISLASVELSRYADSKRTLVYKPSKYRATNKTPSC